MKFVVQLPDGLNRLVDVSPSGTVGDVRSAAGLSPAFSLSLNSERLGDAEAVSRFRELSTFGVIAALPAAPRKEAPPVASGSSAAECPICLEACSHGAPGAPVQVTPCNHMFHAVCLREWSLHSSFCPLCRRSLVVAPPSAPSAPAPGTVYIFSGPAAPPSKPPPRQVH